MPQPYHTTPEWTEETLPAAVRGDHSTKAGVWGLLRVLEGRVRLVFHDPASAVEVTVDRPGRIPPQAVHHVETDGPARMRVEFYREDPLA